MKNFSLIGAGGHCRSVIALLENCSMGVEGIFDDSFQTGEIILGAPVKGKIAEANGPLILALGDNKKREKAFLSLREQIYSGNIFHTTSSREKHITVGSSNLFFAFSYLNNGVSIGDNNIINTRATLEHEVKLGSHNHVAVGAILLGRSTLGNRCFIGSGAIIKDGVSVCDDVVIGANSFVNENITLPGTYVGSPARKIP